MLITTTALLVACAEPTPREILDQLAEIEFYELDSRGTEVEISPGTGSMLYILAPKGQRSLINPEQCRAGGLPFRPTESSLNFPGNGGEALFAVAELQFQVGEEGSAQVNCLQPGVKTLKLAVEPP